ncbi:TonB-linked outer membrane protein, SusC/RagA family [Catalinimonas alkaloidigena]|uniref:TonB-linked outer membrane protein, SusC/RagA family n=1 Tax=Catalinimonas alkaloidigena TaxID=1075417 RepID=A0A1G9MT42_9BACT|nr:SusC/RagA family TonB-linked outer membrane protein [Catalinimonas alkaloidigena]SDL77274.1 TonB-linked outer membrane protein, SusC/RagA family [Catalinimonas alkaloidigena]
MRKRLSLFSLFWGLFLCGPVAWGQRTVSGKITDGTTQETLIGVSVLVKGTTIGTISDATGAYTLNVPADGTTLVFSYIGYTPQDVAINNRSVIDVALEPDVQALQEVVVTALGIERESKALPYATQSIGPQQLNEVRDANVLNTLQGKIAGAYITQGSGGVGSGSRIVLRGNRSIQGSNNALIVVDGVPINNSTYQTATSDFGGVTGSDGASNINPDDIESTTVLRGASAAALYGSQAANGVILITTKKGRSGKISVDVNSGVTRQTVFAIPRFQDQYGQGVGGNIVPNEGASWGAPMQGQSFTNYLGEQASYSPQPDNVRDFFRTAYSFNNSIGVSGGSEKMQTYLSYTNNALQGVVPKNDMSRHTINLRLSNQISEKFSTDAKVTYILQDIYDKPRTGEENAPVIDVYQAPRNVSIENMKQYAMPDAFGIPTPTPWPSTLSSIYQNPYWMIHQTAINQSRDRITGFLTAKYQITSWLSLQGRANLDKYFDKNEEEYSQGTILWTSRPGGRFSRNSIVITQKWFDAMLAGSNNLGEQVQIDYRIGAILQDNQYQNTGAVANGLNIPNKFNLAFGTQQTHSDVYTHTQTQSVFGQTTIAFRDAIFLDASLRNDWASTLPSPYGFQYPSVGLSAVISDLVSLPEVWSFFKLNTSYARVGNGGDPYLLFNTYSYQQGAGAGFIARDARQAIGNLQPEITRSLEIGGDVRFISNRIGLTFTYYKTNSLNQLLLLGLAPASGFSEQYINAGNIQNQGIEVVVNGTPINTANFSWNVTFNLGRNRNKILELAENINERTLGGSYARSATPIVRVGGSYGDLLADGWATDANGRFIVSDAGLPVVTEDQKIIGNFNPKMTLGLSNTFNYKGVSLRVLLDGRVGGIAVSGTEMNLAFSGVTEETAQMREGGWVLDAVTASGEENTTAINAEAFWTSASVTGKRYGSGEFFAYDATNFRVREVSLGYDLPLPVNTFIKGAKLSFVARNLFWLYRGSSILDIPGLGKRKMWFDPDMNLGNSNFQGIEYGTLPSTRDLGLNLKLSF